MNVDIYKSTEQVLAGLEAWQDHMSFQYPTTQETQHIKSLLRSLPSNKLILSRAT